MNLIKILRSNLTKSESFGNWPIGAKMLRLTAVFAVGLALSGAVDVGGINMNTGVNTGKYTVKMQNTKYRKNKIQEYKILCGRHQHEYRRQHR